MTHISISRPLGERARFLRSFLENPRQVGSIVPTSGRTVRAMLDLADVPNAGCVVELGAGTGVFTDELLRRLAPAGRLLVFEIDPALARRLKRRFDDPRVEVIADSATELGAYLDGARADVVVSAVPLTSLPAPIRDGVMRQIAAALAPGGVMVAIQYSKVRRRELQQAFASVEHRFSPFNVPPAFLFACRAPRTAC